MTLTRAGLNQGIRGGKPPLEGKVAVGDIRLEGQKEKLGELLGLLDSVDPWFNIVPP